MENYNPIAAIKSLKLHLYVYHTHTKIKKNDRFNELREKNRLISKRMARIIIKDLQEYRRQFPQEYQNLIKG